MVRGKKQKVRKQGTRRRGRQTQIARSAKLPGLADRVLKGLEAARRVIDGQRSVINEVDGILTKSQERIRAQAADVARIKKLGPPDLLRAVGAAQEQLLEISAELVRPEIAPEAKRLTVSVQPQPTPTQLAKVPKLSRKGDISPMALRILTAAFGRMTVTTERDEVMKLAYGDDWRTKEINVLRGKGKNEKITIADDLFSEKSQIRRTLAKAVKRLTYVDQERPKTVPPKLMELYTAITAYRTIPEVAERMPFL